MKRLLVLMGILAVVLGGLVAFSQLQPERLTAATMEKARETQQKLDQQQMRLAQAQAAPVQAPAAQPAPPTAPAPAPAAGQKDPNVFKVRFECSNGTFVVEVHRDWAPLGAARFEELVKAGFFNEARFFRIVPNFVVQFGLSGDPAVNAEWRDKTIKDEAVKQSNTAGMMTFAKGGPNSRTTQVFINLKDNRQLDQMGFPPFGKVIEGMDVVRTINAQYRELPQQPMIQTQGNAYLKANFPNLDYVKTATLIE